MKMYPVDTDVVSYTSKTTIIPAKSHNHMHVYSHVHAQCILYCNVSTGMPEP